MLRCGDLDSYPLLQYLDLSSNHIQHIEDDALGRLEILITLQLNNNNLTNIPASLPSSLQNLFLRNNQITDIQPSVFGQLINLEILDLSENKLTYLPGLPLPRLITLNLRSSGLRGLSQSVVKQSPNLKDVLLENNPIKCTELLGIAEWATPCRSDSIFELVEIRKIAVKPSTALETFNRWHCLCSAYQRPSIVGQTQPLCLSEKLIVSPRLMANGVRKTIDSKAKTRNQQDLWDIRSKNFSSNKQNDYDNTTQSTSSKDVVGAYLDRKLGDNDGVFRNKSNWPMDVNNGSLTLDGNRRKTDIKNIKNNANNRSYNSDSTNIGKDIVQQFANEIKGLPEQHDIVPLPNGLKMNNQDMPITANTTSYDASNSNMTDETLLSKSKSTIFIERTTKKPWKNISKTNNNKSGEEDDEREDKEKVLPILRKYFMKNATGNDSSQTIKTPSNLHTTINKTTTTQQQHRDNKNSFERKTTSFADGNVANGGGDGGERNKFNETQSVSGLNSPKYMRICCGNPDNIHLLNDKKLLQSNGGGRDDFILRANSEGKNQTDDNDRKIEANIKRRNNKKVDKLKQQQARANDKLKTQKTGEGSAVISRKIMDNDDGDGDDVTKEKLQKIANANKMAHYPENDKLGNLADSLAQMMTRQKGYNRLTQTGLPIVVAAKQSTVVADVDGTTTQQQAQKKLKKPSKPKQKKQQQQQMNNKKEIINWNTNNPISQQDNETTNIKQTKMSDDIIGAGVGGTETLSTNRSKSVMQNEHSTQETNKYLTTAAAMKLTSETTSPKPYTNATSSILHQPLHNIAQNTQPDAIKKLNIPETSHQSQSLLLFGDGSFPDDINKDASLEHQTTANTNSRMLKADDSNRQLLTKKSLIALKQKKQQNKQMENFSIPMLATLSNGTNINNSWQNDGSSSDLMNSQSNKHSKKDNIGIKSTNVTLPAKVGVILGEEINIGDEVNIEPCGHANCSSSISGHSVNFPIKLNIQSLSNGREIFNSIQADGRMDNAVPKNSPEIHTKQTINNAKDNTVLYYDDDAKASTIHRSIHSSIGTDDNIAIVHNHTGSNTNSTSTGLSEQWNDVRSGSDHPGLFIVIGTIAGMFISLALIHLYRCRKPWCRQRPFHPADDDQEQYTPAHRDLLPMEILDSSTIHYADTPIDIW